MHQKTVFDMFDLNGLGVNTVLSLLACILFTYYIIQNWVTSRKHPPGPIGVPLLGYYPFLGKKPNITLRNVSKKYGDIFSFYIGPQHIICISDYHLAKEILNHPLTLARPPHAFDFLTAKGGFSGMNGEEWQEQRRFALYAMRNLGLGKGLWETLIQEDAVEFIKLLKKTQGSPFSFEDSLALSQITNSLSLLFGRHLDPEAEKEDIEIMHGFGKLLMDSLSSVDLVINMPWIIKLVEVLKISKLQGFLELLRKFEHIFEKEVNKRMKSDEDLTKDDFIGCYLKEMEKREAEGKPHTFTKLNLLGNLFILFVAGQDSTIASLGWMLLLMSGHQDIQAKVCDEIDRVAGRDGVLGYDDRIRTPYTFAAIMEMMRWVSISALFPPRYVLEDFEFKNYTIPKGSHVVCNSWAMLHDPRYFEDPMEYKPERFLNEDGTKVIKPEGYGPFSFGKRNCPGEGVAMMSVYLYFVILMQKFHIRTPHGLPPNMDYKFSAGIMPPAQKLCFIER